MNKKALIILLILAIASAFVSPGAAYAAGGDLKGSAAGFFDGLFKENMEKYHVSGLAFVMVKDGAIVYKKGYGTANIEDNIPVDPDVTVFRVGSVSKLFTTAAVMQLSEQGRLDLNDDVNKYLDSFKIKNRFDEKITISNLLTHTAGFDERVIGMAAKEKKDVLPLEKYVSEFSPQVFVKPGTVYSYSNYGMTLAGYIVEKASGVPFNEYTEKNILNPLDMRHSSFDPSSAVTADLAQGYTYSNGVQNPVQQDFLNVVPAGGLYTTASDMANFITAVLQDGSFNGKQIMKKETAADMKKQHFTCSSDMAGIAYGFHEKFANGQRLIEHTGGWSDFTSLLTVIPEQNAGFFFSCNSGEESSSGITTDVTDKIMDMYFPASAESGKNTGISGEKTGEKVPASFNGTYEALGGYSMYSIEKIMRLLKQMDVRTDDEGFLTFSHALSGSEGRTRWTWSGSGLFKCNDARLRDYRMTFSSDGRYMYIDQSAFKKLAWYETASFQLIVFIFFIVVFLAGVLLWPIRGMVRRIRRKPPAKHKLPEALTGIVCILNLLFLILLGTALFIFRNDMLYGIPMGLAAVMFIPVISALLVLLMAAVIFTNWKRGYLTRAGKIYYVFFTLCQAAFIPFLYYWNLIGIKT